MKKCLAVLLTAVLLLCAAPLAGFTAVDRPEMDFAALFPSAHAAEIVASGNCGEVDEENGLDGSQVTWTLDGNGQLIISGTGKMMNYDYSGPWINYWNDITAVFIQPGVTEIGKDAFCGLKKLQSVTISNSVTRIGQEAFIGCNELDSLTIPDSVTIIENSAFTLCPIKNLIIGKVISNNCPLHQYGLYDLVSVIILDGVTAIGDNAFASCSHLSEIIMPNSVTAIGKSAFFDCKSLTSFTLPSSITTIGEGSFQSCTSLQSIILPESITEIGGYAFYGCESLSSIKIPSNVTSVKEWTFSKCKNMVDISLPSSLISIENNAFRDCEKLTSLSLPNGLSYIGNYAFESCKALSNIAIPESVKTIGRGIFSFCEELTECMIPESFSSIGESMFHGCTKLASVTIPDSVTVIGEDAFSKCVNLTTLSIPENVTEIGHGAFEGCSGLTSLVIPAGVTSIGNHAFQACKKLREIIIPDSVSHIPSGAFWGCTELSSVYIPDGVTSISSFAFYQCTSLASIIIPDSVNSIEDSEYAQSVFESHTLIHGYVGSYVQQWAEKYNYAFAPIGDSRVKLYAPEIVTEPILNVYGFANPGADVVCSVNGTETVTVQAAANGRWSAILPLTGAKDGDSFTIKAAVTVDGKTAEQTAAVTYKPDAVVLEEFTLNHSCYSVTINGARLGVSVPNFTFVPGNPLAFKIKVSNNDRVEKLFVVSTKDGDSKPMELTYNKATGFWFAGGFFDEADQNYVPGVFTVRGVDKDGKEFDCGVTIKINFLIDPSGYAYEAVTSNKLEGVTAAVYYKDAQGHELLWNAETADQLNPIKTLSDGAFAWVVPEGQWQVRLTKDGYQEASSEWLPVPPIQENVYIPMVSTNAPEVAYCNVYADRAEITFSQYMNVDTVNEGSVKFDGCEGTVAPLDKTETSPGSGVFYAKTFSFTPEKAFSGEVSVSVAFVLNYAGHEMTAPFTAAVTVAAEPKNLTATQNVTVKYGETAEITVSAENAAGKTVSVSCDSANVTLSETSMTLDETGRATLTVTGDMPGTAELTFTLDGTTLTASAKVSVTVSDAEQPATPTDPDEKEFSLGDVDGDGEVTSGDARLALRASVRLEKYEPGSAPFLAADADGNGEIESSDARTILRVSVKLETF